MRATFLHFRNPKEMTPGFYVGNGPNSNENWATSSFLMNRGSTNSRRKRDLVERSESLKGSFTALNKFGHGSIYHNIGQRTTTQCGPGRY
jgi:hypothetical protein